MKYAGFGGKYFNFQQQNTNLSLHEVIDGLCFPNKQQQPVQEFVSLQN